MTDTLRKRALILAPFTDAGTGETFAVDDTPLIDAGSFANYEHAGLVRAPNADPEESAVSEPAPAPRKPRK